MARRFRRRRKMKGSSKKLAIKALKGVKRLNKMVGKTEKKAGGTGVTTVTVSSSGVINQLTFIGQGTGHNQRSGEKVVIKSLQGQFLVIKHASAVDQNVRVIAFVDKRQASDSKTTVGTVLQDVSTLAFIDRIFGLNRFRILFDRFIELDNTSKATKAWRWFQPMNMEQWWNGSLNTDIEKNGIYILILTNDGTNSPTLIYNVRTTYYDT